MTGSQADRQNRYLIINSIKSVTKEKVPSTLNQRNRSRIKTAFLTELCMITNI